MTTRTLTVISILAISAAVIGGVWFSTQRCDWTGFGPCATATPADTAIRPAKTLWDWLDLLIVPLVLAGGAAGLARTGKLRDQRRAERRAHDEREIAQDQQREDALQQYFDRLTDLQAAGKLQHVSGDPKPGSDDESALRVNLALRSRTLALLRRLDGERKGYLVQFLVELRLIDAAGRHVLYMDGADLRGAQLSGMSLWPALLSRADFRGADLSESYLDEADLSEADLRDTVLTGVHIRGTTLRKANLADQKLASLKFEGCYANHIIFARAELRDVEFIEWEVSRDVPPSRCALLAADFTMARLTNTKFTGAYLPDATFAKAQLSNVTFTRCDLSDVDLVGATLQDVQMIDCTGVDTLKRSSGAT